ncbi:MAG: response regulator [Deltaproteobacteria bacterium]|nr:response regulator [Deltaproteobacteria bacterium]
MSRSSSPSPPPKPLVLIADDDPEAAGLLQMLVEREGCEAILAHDGATALEMARELPRPDLVLLDLELPVMDGRAFLETLRSDPTLSGIPVVVVSGAPDAKAVRATDNVRKGPRLTDGIARVLERLRVPPEPVRAT